MPVLALLTILVLLFLTFAILFIVEAMRLLAYGMVMLVLLALVGI